MWYLTVGDARCFPRAWSRVQCMARPQLQLNPFSRTKLRSCHPNPPLSIGVGLQPVARLIAASFTAPAPAPAPATPLESYSSNLLQLASSLAARSSSIHAVLRPCLEFAGRSHLSLLFRPYPIPILILHDDLCMILLRFSFLFNFLSRIVHRFLLICTF